MICLYGVVRALAWAHLRGIIHRDMKAENVFLSLKKHRRLADFGLAKMHKQGIGMSIMKAGSMPYMAPEVLVGDEGWSFVADIYAYAIIFWEIVAGRRWEPIPAQIGRVRDQNQEFRPPLDPVSKQEYRALLTRIWAWDIAKRPEFEGIAELLECREYWLPNTNRGEFLRYIDRLKRRGGQNQGDTDSGCGQLLSRVNMATELTEILNDPKIRGNGLDDFSAKVVHSLGYLCGHGATQNEDVMQAVLRCLAEGQYLGPKQVNQLDEDLDEDVEPEVIVE
jgi:serine/threonine protein kinase